MSSFTERMPVWRVKCRTIEPGLISSERFARIEDADGGLEVVGVCDRLIEGDRLEVGWIGALGDRILIELPVESTSGSWRMWVKRTLLESSLHDSHGS